DDGSALSFAALLRSLRAVSRHARRSRAFGLRCRGGVRTRARPLFRDPSGDSRSTVHGSTQHTSDLRFPCIGSVSVPRRDLYGFSPQFHQTKNSARRTRSSGLSRGLDTRASCRFLPAFHREPAAARIGPAIAKLVCKSFGMFRKCSESSPRLK